MQDESSQLKAAHHTTGIFKYMATLVEPSLYCNGKVLTRRDKDGSDAGWKGVVFTEQRMPVTKPFIN